MVATHRVDEPSPGRDGFTFSLTRPGSRRNTAARFHSSWQVQHGGVIDHRDIQLMNGVLHLHPPRPKLLHVF